ncbi:Uncharacterised protein [Mycobacteroides abscessus subsp. abscessus]|nr:Uncharacterised protein [Mycobacteroides abscessus subsp. abscessus]
MTSASEAPERSCSSALAPTLVGRVNSGKRAGARQRSPATTLGTSADESSASTTVKVIRCALRKGTNYRDSINRSLGSRGHLGTSDRSGAWPSTARRRLRSRTAPRGRRWTARCHHPRGVG